MRWADIDAAANADGILVTPVGGRRCRAPRGSCVAEWMFGFGRPGVLRDKPLIGSGSCIAEWMFGFGRPRVLRDKPLIGSWWIRSPPSRKGVLAGLLAGVGFGFGTRRWTGRCCRA